MTTRELTKLAHRFMKLLDLQDWIPGLTLKQVRREPDKDGSRIVGYCYWHTETRNCEIEITRGESDYDTVHSLVHELLHIRLEGHKTKEPKYDALYECGLNKTTTALMKAWYTPVE